MKNGIVIVLLAFFVTVILVGAAAAADEPGPISVTDVSPANNTENVPNAYPNVNVTFDKPIKEGTAFYNIRITANNTTDVEIGGQTITDNKLTIIPSGSPWSWSPGTVYEVYIPVNAVTDSDDNTLVAPFTSSFTTKIAPAVTSVNPADNATKVPNNARTITVTFNKQIHTENGYSGIYVKDYAHNSFIDITQSVDGNKLIITANEDWTSSIYGIYIWPDAVVDEYGNTMEEPFHSKFSNTNKTYDTTQPPTKPEPVIILTFDDMFVSHYSIVKDYLSGKGLNPTFFLNAALFGQGGDDNMLSEAQVLELFADGWLIANHGWDHTLLDELTEAEQIAQILQNQGWILANTNGQGAYIFATPGGHANADTITAFANTGIIFCRGNVAFGPVWNPNLDDGTQSIYGLPMQNFAIKDTTNTADIMLALIEQYFANDQSVIIVIHQVTDTPEAGSTDISTAEFKALIDRIIARGWGDNCLNPYQWLDQWKLDGQYLTVDSSNPGNNATNVSITDKIIEIIFDSPIRKGSAFDSIHIENTFNNSHPLIAKYINGNKLTITALSNWTMGITYNIYIPINALTGANGITLASNYTSIFTTTPPLNVESINPANNTNNIPITNKIVEIIFNNPIQAGTEYDNIKVVNTSDNSVVDITKTIDGNKLTLTALSNWAMETTYKIIIPINAVIGANGTTLANNYTSEFTTATPIEVNSTKPVDNATNVPITDKIIEIIFDSPIQIGSAYDNIKIVKTSNNSVVNITKIINGNKLILTALTNWAMETTYKIIIPINAVTLANGATITQDFESTFTTTPPLNVESINPANNTNNIPITNKIVEIIFNNPIQAGNEYNNIKVVNTSDNSIVNVTKTINGNKLILTALSNWAMETTYKIIIPINAITDSNGATLTQNFESTFTTLEAIAPTIISVDPTNNAVNVPSGKKIVITFSEKIKLGSKKIELLNSNNKAIAFTTKISEKVLTITPTSNLAESKYKLVLNTGSVTDLVGNPLTGKTINFSVGTSPTVTSSDPKNNAINVATSKVIKVTFNEKIKLGSKKIGLLNSSNKAIAFTTKISGKVLTVTPKSKLAESKYRLILHTGSVTDLAGNPLALIDSYFIVGTSPTVTSSDPKNNAINVATSKVIKVTFNEKIKLGSKKIGLLNSSNKAIAFTTKISGKVLTVTPKSKLAESKYKLVLNTGSVTDLAGNPLTGKTINFSAGTPPTVKSTTPSKSATRVSLTSAVTINFSENIKSSANFSGIYIKNLTTGKKVALAAKTISGEKITLKMKSIRAKNNVYQVYIPVNAVKDGAGNTLKNSYSLKFRTVK